MRRILLAEDETELLKMFSSLLRQEGFDVLEAEDGMQGLDCIERCKILDLIITDVNMPKFSGIELAQEVRKRGLTVPILFITGRPYMLAQHQITQPFAYLIKPFRLSVILNCVQELLSATYPTNPEKHLNLNTNSPSF